MDKQYTYVSPSAGKWGHSGYRIQSPILGVFVDSGPGSGGVPHQSDHMVRQASTKLAVDMDTLHYEIYLTGNKRSINRAQNF